MKSTIKYEVNGKVVNTLKEVATELNRSRVNKADLDKLGVNVITVDVVDVDELVKAKAEKDLKAEEVKAADTKDVKAADTKDVKAADTKEVKAEEVKAEEVKAEKDLKAEEVKAADTKDVKAEEIKDVKAEKAEKADSKPATDSNTTDDDMEFDSVDELQEVIKDMPTDSLIDWADSLGLNIYENIDNAGIRRMRVAMALKSKFFPTATKTASKSNSSIWRKFTAPELTALCDQHNLKYTIVTQNENIQRMWAIKALNTAGITPPEK